MLNTGEDLCAGEWYRALSLDERLDDLRRHGSSVVDPGDPGFARRRLDRWKAQPPFSGNGFFARRLAAAGITEKILLDLLGEPAESVRDRCAAAPEWLEELLASYSRADGTASVRPEGSQALTQAAYPLIRQGRERLQRGIADLAGDPSSCLFNPETVADLLVPGLLSRLFSLLSRSLVLELHAAGLEGRISGESPDQRFESFVQLLEGPGEALEILRRYPVLARLSVETLKRWESASLELLRHLRDDGDAIRALFSPERDPGPLDAVESDAGDVHRGGRSVLLLRFTSGLRMVYKPRSVAIEARFQDLLAWAGDRGFRPTFRTLRVLDRGDHGWAEFVEPSPCAREEEIRRFYRRQGGYLALLYLLEATDLHQENLIAAGEHPVLVDLEALFHPWIDGLGQDIPDDIPGQPLHDCVLRTGLLPTRIWGKDETGGIDLSGLGGRGGQSLPLPALVLEDCGTDQMRFVRSIVTLPGAANRPSLAGKEILVADYTADVAEGFEQLYSLLLARREELLAADGPLTAFAGTEVRVVLRPTRFYSLMLFENLHPQALADALDRDRLLDRLWTGVEHRPFLQRVIAAEQREMRCGDVPVFTTRPDSHDLWTGDGEHLLRVFAETGLDRVKRRLRGMDSADQARQVWIVRGTLDLTAPDTLDRPAREQIEAAPPSHGELLEAALAVGHRLEALALRGRRDAYWLTAQSPGDNEWSLTPALLDLHLGLPGIALFLAHLSAATADEGLNSLARAAVVSMLGLLDRAPRMLTNLGGFSGRGSVIYTLAQLGALWQETTLLDRAAAIAETLPEEIAADPHHDVVGGAAGCLAALLALHEQRPDGRALEMATLCGRHLLSQARPMKSGVGWQSELTGPLPLAGFSHGAAGIAWALLRLFGATGDRRFRETAAEALVYERTLYDPAARNWIDLRQSGQGEHRFLCAWCHGAAGIGLARLDGLRYLETPEIQQEISTAVETTLAMGFGKNHCLCHGDLGNLELVTLAAERLSDPALRRRAGQIAGGVLESIARQGWIPGLPLRAEPTGLMVGLAGIGYGLLRLAEPKRMPCVLLLASAPTD